MIHYKRNKLKRKGSGHTWNRTRDLELGYIGWLSIWGLSLKILGIGQTFGSGKMTQGSIEKHVGGNPLCRTNVMAQKEYKSTGDTRNASVHPHAYRLVKKNLGFPSHVCTCNLEPRAKQLFLYSLIVSDEAYEYIKPKSSGRHAFSKPSASQPCSLTSSPELTISKLLLSLISNYIKKS